MRVLALSTWARFSDDQVDQLRERLPDRDADIVLVLVTRPAEPLGVTRCLVTGPSLRPGRTVRDFPFRGEPLSRLDRLDRAVSRRLPGLGSDRRRMLASGVVGSAVVREEAAAADLVIALDYNATWAAWKLARRVPGPAVTFQPEGLVRRLTEPRE